MGEGLGEGWPNIDPQSGAGGFHVLDDSFTKTAILGPQKLTPKWTQNVTQNGLQTGTQNDVNNNSKLIPKWTQN